MKVDHIAKAVITAEHATKEQKQKLNQAERKLLLVCCEAFEDLKTTKFKDLGNKNQEKKIRSLIEKLQENPPRKPGSCCLCHIITSLFKTIANALHLRVGINRLENKLEHSFNHTYDKSQLSQTYRTMFTDVMKSNLPLNQKRTVMKTIESFYLLHLKKPDFFLAEELTDDMINKIFNSTGFTINGPNRQILKSLKDSSEILAYKFNNAKMEGQLLQFFNEAFNQGDKTFDQSFKRIEDYGDLYQHPNVEKKIFDLKNLIKKLDQIDAEEPDYVKLAQNAEDKVRDKQETLFALAENFVELQFDKYANDNPYYKLMTPWYKAKEKMQQNENFNENYANIENFENYLLNEVGVIGKKCLDGEIKQEDLPQIIENFVEMGLLGKKPRPIIWNAPNLDPNWMFPQMNKPINEVPVGNFDNEYTKPYELIFADLKKYGADKDEYAKTTVQACYNLAVYKDHTLQMLAKDPGNNTWGWHGAQRLIGLILHSEHPQQEVAQLVIGAPGEFLSAYEKYKEENRLSEFFQELGKIKNSCLEGRLRTLQDIMIGNGLFAKASLQDRLAPPLVPLVSKKLKKQKNFGELISVFIELQGRKYAKDKNIAIDAQWLEKAPKNTMTKIQNENEFQTKYNTVENLKKFLIEEAKVVGKVTSEGTITEEDVTRELNEAKGILVEIVDEDDED